MDDLLEEFLEETNESIDELDNNIILLEKSNYDEKLINSIFRTFHTIKGTCGFLDLNRLGKVAHASESLISRFRDGSLEISKVRISLILDAIERIKLIIDSVSNTGAEPPGSDDDLINQLLAEVNTGKTSKGTEETSHEKGSGSTTIQEGALDVDVPETKTDSNKNDIISTPKVAVLKGESQEQQSLIDKKRDETHKRIKERQDEADKLFAKAKTLENEAKQSLDSENINERSFEAEPTKEQKIATEAESEEVPLELNNDLEEDKITDDEGKTLKGKELEDYIDNLFNEDAETTSEETINTDSNQEQSLDNQAQSTVVKKQPTDKQDEFAQKQIDEMAANFGMEVISSESEGDLDKNNLKETEDHEIENIGKGDEEPFFSDEKQHIDETKTFLMGKRETEEESNNESDFQEKSLAASFVDELQSSEKLSKQDVTNIAANQELAIGKQEVISPAKSHQHTLKVNVDLLENLMNTVSELVLTRNQLLQTLKNTSDSTTLASLHHLNNITTELQEGILKTRMQPIGTAWQKIPRLVRKLSIDLNKNIELKLIGEDTELDKQIIEQISDPMVHLIRNAADHGIEDPETRIKKGKSNSGVITLKASQEGGQIIIEIMDDGWGLNFEKIKQKALSQGIISQSQAEQMNNNQIAQLLFQPGFSTSSKITAVSGRGVGLDVVKNNLNTINGSVEISSFEDQGSIFTLKIPLSLSIIAGLKVDVSGHIFVIPQVVVQEVIRHPSSDESVLKNLKRLPVLQFRGQLMPIIYLNTILDIDKNSATTVNSESQDGEKNNDIQVDDGRYILVISTSSFRFGLVVDKILDSEEIVVKPLPRLLNQTEIFAGNTILGDGSVVMILDLLSISRSQGDLSISSSQEILDMADSEINKKDSYSYLLFRNATDNQVKIISLLSVFRIEEFNASQIIYPQGRPSIHYHNQLMPIVHFDELSLDTVVNAKQNNLSTLIFKNEEKYLAIIVDKIEDIIEGDFKLDINNIGKKVIGNAIINQTTADIVDINYFFRKYVKNLTEPDQVVNSLTVSLRNKILLVSPDPIENQFLKSGLTELGAEITISSLGQKAIEICMNRKDFDVILIKQKLADMDGNKLLKRLKENPIWQNIPVIALSNNIQKDDKQQNRNHGFFDTIFVNDINSVIKSILMSKEPQTN